VARVHPFRFHLLALALIAALVCAPSAFAGRTDPTNPLIGKRMFMDCEASHQSSARLYNPWYAVRRNPSHETALRKIAEVPAAKWFAGIAGMPTRHVERYFANVDDPQWGGDSCRTRLRYGQRDEYVGDYPVVAIRRLVNGNCAGMRRQSVRQYQAWIESFIRMSQMSFVPHPGQRYQYWMGKPFPHGNWVPVQRPMTIILEPDAIGLMGARRSCLKRSEVPGRLALLGWAAKRLAQTPGFNVYIDAGSSSWLKAGKVISYLRQANVASTRGFALGSTHFNRTHKEIAYGDKIARALGGKHYVVNTAENANGALPKRKWGKWGSKATACNPRNAGLGTLPTTNTPSVYADAYLWISRPGLSSNGKRGAPQCGKKNGPGGNIFWIKKALWEAHQASFSKAPWPPLPL
jgi:Glycosyl hydrolases family 6